MQLCTSRYVSGGKTSEAGSEASALAELPPMENKNILWRWVAETCGVSHSTGGEKKRILTSALSRNLHIRGKCEQHCEHLGSLDNLCIIWTPESSLLTIMTFLFGALGGIATSLLLHHHKHRNTMCTLQTLMFVYSLFAANIPTGTWRGEFSLCSGPKLLVRSSAIQK